MECAQSNVMDYKNLNDFKLDFGISPHELNELLNAGEMVDEWPICYPVWNDQTRTYCHSQHTKNEQQNSSEFNFQPQPGPSGYMTPFKSTSSNNTYSLRKFSSKTQSHRKDGKLSQLYRTSTRAIIWKIPDFRSLPKCAEYSLDSPSFTFDKATWCFRLYPNARRENEIDPDSKVGKNDSKKEADHTYIGITLVRFDSHVPQHKLRYNVMLMGEDFIIHSVVACFDGDHEENGEMNFVERWYVLKDSSGLLQKDVLTLMGQVSSDEPSDIYAFSKIKLMIQNSKDVRALCENFKNMLLNGDNHDVILKVKDKEFRAHQNILRARSPVFASMLSHDMIEKNSGAIDIPDCDPVAFEQFLLYLYSGGVEALNVSNMLPLYYMADKYDVGYLKESCCRHFIKISLSSANVPEVIQVAPNHGDADLLKLATNYFVKEVNNVMRTVEWQSFVTNNPIQANELFIKAAENWNKT